MDKEDFDKLKQSTGIVASVKKIMEEEKKRQSDQMRKLSESMRTSVVAPRPYKIPDIKLPTKEEQDHYQSASVFMESLAKEALEWKRCLGDEYHPAIIAILYGGIQINVKTLSQVSFHGIRIEGELNGAPCTMLAHQSSVQMLCHAVKNEPDSPSRPIGFIWDSNEIEV